MPTKASPAKRAPRNPDGKPKPRQQYIPGAEPPSIPAIDDAAEDYVEARNARMRLLEREVELADALLALMREHKLESYTFEGYTVRVDHLDKIKVKRSKDENGEE